MSLHLLWKTQIDQVEKLGHLSGKYKLSNDEMSKYKTSLTQVLVKIVWAEHDQHSLLVLIFFSSGDLHHQLSDHDHINSFAAK